MQSNAVEQTKNHTRDLSIANSATYNFAITAHILTGLT